MTGESRAGALRTALVSAGLFGGVWRTPGEPTIDLVRQATTQARHEGCDMVIAIGGGSALDTGKAIAALLTNPRDPLDYVEVIGKGQRLTVPSAPMIAIPTTSGTGSEVTRNAVLGSPEHRVKVSLRSPYMLPRLAVIDPELTFDLPPEVTASTGLDALTQVIEPYVSTRANPMTDGFCLEGLRRAAHALRRVYEDGRDIAARSDMALTSLLSGLALANAGLGAVHGFAAPLGGMFQAPHGALCAALLPHATRVNIESLRRRAPDSRSLERYAQIAQILTNKPTAQPEDAVGWLTEICAALNIPPLRTYGIHSRDIAAIVAKATAASSMKSNPIMLTNPELEEIVQRAI
jgi:alcohol dehydrogenase class IV